jgi:hypothetical protein
MLMPLYGFLEGDTIGLLVLAHDTDLVRDVVLRMQAASDVRVAPRMGLVARVGPRVLEPEMTVAGAGLAALDRIDVGGGPA